MFIARDELAGDCLVWNGDTLVSNALMARVVANAQPGICVTIDRKDGYDDDDMKVVEAATADCKAIGKRLADGVNAESIGLLAFRGGGAEQFATRSTRRHAHHRGHDHLVSARDSPDRAGGRRRRARHQGEEWGEVDFPPDVAAARALFERWDAAT